MYRYRRLLIGLDGSERDIAVIRYAAKIAQMAKSHAAYFVHIAANLDIPEALSVDFPDVAQEAKKEMKATIERTVRKHFAVQRTPEVACDVLAGSPLGELLRFSRDKSSDLILVGRKRDPHESGRIPVKLARKALCLFKSPSAGVIANSG